MCIRDRVEALAENAREFGVEYYDEHDRRQGVVHIIGPEQGFKGRTHLVSPAMAAAAAIAGRFVDVRSLV